MFENSPATVASQPNSANTNRSTASRAAKAAHQEAVELYERAKLHSSQKIILVSITVGLVIVLVGGGVWLNSYLPNLVSNQPTSQVITPPINTTPKDSDGDSLTDTEELQVYHTNPRSKDTDGDGYTDDNELNNGYDPNGPGKL